MKPLGEIPSPLSPRQTQILSLLAQGYRLGEIAQRLGISDSAVNLYLSNTKQKLGLKTKEHCLALAVRNGWLSKNGATLKSDQPH
ncbi:response regulator transcription factor [Celeribacter persicus]|jgi:Response regulator containing a CheY-like receiver domain and an HTH DNA-binding domain|uniref:Regulatory LuxR family protein n=1 Tax=Celeribacter persicus TaxID=1651082 RepID=A0A2T5HWJ5_9RHOB|nr:helix-turn-helix transcriptional regulator [Celeribacter persicus]PTQ75944.1 regulatory LuxR family protein [Celeribacter persicus]